MPSDHTVQHARFWTKKRTLFALSLLAFFGVFYWWQNGYYRRQWEAYKRDAIARGVIMEASQLSQPPIPDEENFAATPMIKALFTAAKNNQPIPDWFASLDLWNAGNSQIKGGRTSIWGMEDWRDYFLEKGVLASAGKNPAEDVLKAIATCGPELVEISAALQRPSVAFPNDYSLGAAMPFPYLRPLRTTAAVFELSALANLEAGKSQQAAEDAETIFALSQTLKDDGAILSFLVSQAIIFYGARTVEAGLQQGKWHITEIGQLQKALANISPLLNAKSSMKGERIFCNSSMEIVRKSPHKVVAMTAMGSVTLPRYLEHFYPDDWLYANQLLINRFYDTYDLAIPAALRGEKMQMPGYEVEDLDWMKAHWLKGTQLAYSMSSIQTLTATRNTALFIEAKLQHLRAGLVLEQHRLETGSYPEKLSELNAPSELLRDPVDHQPLRYRKTEKGYDLWSIGRDRIDDSGKQKRLAHERDQPDWLWQMKRSAAAK